MGIIEYVYENAKTAISEKNPNIIRKIEEAHLIDNEFHLNASQYREKTTLASGANRVKKLIDSGLDPYDSFNIAQHQMIDIAQAYLKRNVLEQFQEAIKAIEDGNSKTLC